MTTMTMAEDNVSILQLYGSKRIHRGLRNWATYTVKQINYMQNIKTCYRSLSFSGTHGLRLQGEGQTKQLYQLYKLRSVQFLCGFSWERCRTATMQSDPFHCPLQSERVRSPHNAPRGRDIGRILWVQTLTYVLHQLHILRCCVHYHVILDRVITAPIVYAFYLYLAPWVGQFITHACIPWNKKWAG